MEGRLLGELARLVEGELRGDENRRITGVGTLAGAGPEDVAFLANPRYRGQLSRTAAAAVVLAPADADACPVDAIVVSNPYLAYARISRALTPGEPWVPGRAPGAQVAEDAEVDPSARVEANAVVESGARIGARTRIGPGAVIGRGVVIGSETVIHANVVIAGGCRVGSRVILHPGVVIGADGFGLAHAGDHWEKVPQRGAVVIEDDVEVGANTTIDRGAVDDTVIEAGVKLDNLIQVGHNVRIGAHTAIAACTAIAGSVRIGRHCVIGGAVAIAGHLEIADRVTITGMSMVSHSIREPGTYSSGLPLDDNHNWRRNAARFRQLDELARRLRALERRLRTPDTEER